MAYETIIYEKTEGIGTITLNRPRQKNALSLQLAQEMREVVEEIDKDDGVRAVIITGGPECFCGGGDIKQQPIPPTFLLELNSLFCKIEDLEKPTIAAINGWCLGGGLELAMVCDLRVASETALIGDRHIKIGIIGGGGSPARLPRLVGASKAKELIFTGGTIDGNEAYRIGLVNRVCPEGKCMEEAMALAGTIAGMALLPLKLSKRAINGGLDADLHAALHVVDRCLDDLAGSKEWAETRKAFAERHAPESK